MNGATITIDGTADPKSRSARSWREHFDRQTWLAAVWVFLGYYFGAKLGFALTFEPHPVSVLWPPNSVLVAALLLTPPRTWWLLLLVALPAHWIAQLQHNVPPTMIFCWFVSNSCEALIGAGAARLLLGQPMRFNRLRNVGVFSLCVVCLGPILSSFVDSAFVIWNKFGSGSYWEIWRIRTTSNVLAALVVAPLIVAWATNARAVVFGSSTRRYLEAAFLALTLVLISVLVLYRDVFGQDWLLPYLPLPFLIWAAVRFGSLGASTAIAAIGFLTIWSAARGHGPFANGSPEQNALSIQIFLIVLSVPILFLGTLIEEVASGETDLRESEARFHVVADTAPVLMWMSGTDKACTFLNKAWLEFTGRTMEQNLGNGWTDNVHPDDYEMCFQTYATAFDARQPFNMKYRLRRHDGEYRYVTDTGVPHFGPHGTFRGYIGSCVDVTDLLQQEKALQRQRQDIDQLSRLSLLGEMTATIAHELNQPLTGITSNAKAAQRFIDRGNVSIDNIREILVDIGSDARRASNVIKHIRNTIKKGAAIREEIDLNELVTQVARMLQPDARAQSCRLTTLLTKSLPPIEGDPIEIQQVLINLIRNAFDAMGKMPVEEREVRISTEPNGDGTIEVTVHDAGPGISKEAEERLFEQFFTTKEEGIGMGLAIVRSVIESHGGKIKAENAKEGGARFYFTLPGKSKRTK
jgi:two-component system, LuxR family, sensor kinase FixL